MSNYQRNQRINTIRARLRSAAEGHAVHIHCNGECSARTPLDRYYCYRCGEDVWPEEVAERAEAHYEQDITFLLALLQ